MALSSAMPPSPLYKPLPQQHTDKKKRSHRCWARMDHKAHPDSCVPGPVSINTCPAPSRQLGSWKIIYNLHEPDH